MPGTCKLASAVNIHSRSGARRPPVGRGAESRVHIRDPSQAGHPVAVNLLRGSQ